MVGMKKYRVELEENHNIVIINTINKKEFRLLRETRTLALLQNELLNINNFAYAWFLLYQGK